MQDNILLLFPIVVIGILFYKVKISPGSTLWEDCWNRDDAKSMQVFAAFGVILHRLAQLISNYDNKEENVSVGMTGTFKPRIFDRMEFIEQKVLPAINE